MGKKLRKSTKYLFKVNHAFYKLEGKCNGNEQFKEFARGSGTATRSNLVIEISQKCHNYNIIVKTFVRWPAHSI